MWKGRITALQPIGRARITRCETGHWAQLMDEHAMTFLPRTIVDNRSARRRDFTGAGRGIAALLCAAVAGLPGTVNAAGYVNDRAGWQALTPEARIGYVQGLNDSLNYTFVDDTLVAALNKRGRTACLAAQRTTAAQLSELITIAYRSQQNAVLASSAIYILKMSDICREQINRARQEFGLGPQ